MKPLLYNLKLTTKKLLFFIIIVIVMMTATKFFLPKVYTETLHLNHVRAGRELIRNFADLMQTPLYNNDAQITQAIVDTIQKFGNTLYVRVYDNRGNIFIPSNIEIDPNYTNFMVMREAVYHDFNFVGTLEIALDLKEIDEQASVFSQKVIYIMIYINIFTLTLLFIFLYFYVSKPIKRIFPSITRIINGDLNHEIRVFSNDEIGLLSQKINEMIHKQRQNYTLINNVIESMSSVVFVINENFEIIKFNINFEKFIKANKLMRIDEKFKNKINFSQQSQQSIWSTIPYFVKYINAFKEVIDKKKIVIFPRESFIDNKYYKIFMYPLKHTDFTGIVIRLDDITEEEMKDAQIRHTLKMEALGSLVGGLAHDFNNILCGIVSTVSILKYKLQNKETLSIEKMESLISDIDLSANRAEDISKQFLSMSKKTDINFEVIDLNYCIKNIEKICHNTFEKSIIIDISKFPENAFIMGDITLIEQVMLNITINARHAMTIMKNEPNEGGTLTITVEIVQLDKALCDIYLEPSEEYWKIIISDTGVGISEENIQKIWEPFFTTKDFVNGTGLGLAMVYRIISQHNGFIEVESQLGKGTSFSIYLPKIIPNENEVQNEKKENLIYKGKGETILIVDDEALIRDIASSILMEINYQVLCAENGRIAVDKYIENKDKIALVILDLTMPVMNGRDAYFELKKINPDIKAILCSGFINQDLIDNMSALGLKHFIKKPFTIDFFTKVVYEVLNA